MNNLSNEEIKDLMGKNADAAIQELSSPKVLNMLKDYFKRYNDKIMVGIAEIANSEIVIDIKDFSIGSTVHISDEGFADNYHIVLSTVLNPEWEIDIIMPKPLGNKLYENGEIFSGQMNMDLFGEAVGNIFNKSFSEYESITEPFFGIKSVTESIGIPAKGATGQYQVAHMSFKVNNEPYEFLVLFSLPLTNVIKDKHLPATSATVPEMKDFSKQAKQGGGAQRDNLEFLYDVPVEFTAVLGTTKKTIKEALNLGVGEVVVLDQYIDASVDLFLNNQRVGKGEVVVIDNHFAIKIVEINAFNDTKMR